MRRSVAPPIGKKIVTRVREKSERPDVYSEPALNKDRRGGRTTTIYGHPVLSSPDDTIYGSCGLVLSLDTLFSVFCVIAAAPGKEDRETKEKENKRKKDR